jgi:predicted ribosome quality control (RQC) complex YloA/Tae2 family protein
MDLYLLRAVFLECRDRLPGMILGAPRQLDRYRLAFPLHDRGERVHLLVSLAPEDPRMHLLGELPGESAAPSPFLRTAGRLLRDLEVVGLEMGLAERVVRLDLRGRYAPFRRLALVVELTGRRCNLLLLDAEREDRIVVPYKHVALDRSDRPLVPDMPYRPLPAREQLDLCGASLAEIRGTLPGELGPGSWRELTARLRPLGRLAAEEVLARARDAGEVAELLREAAQGYAAGRIPVRIQWVRTEGRDAERARITVLPWSFPGAVRTEEFVSPSRACAAFYEPLREQRLVQGLRQRLLRALRARRKRLERAVVRAGRDLAELGEPRRHRELGELILARLAEIPRGAAKVELEPLDGGAPVEVELDPKISAAQNAERCFARARKCERGRRLAQERLEELRSRLGELQGWLDAVSAAETRGELEALEGQLGLLGWLDAPGSRRREPKQQGRKLDLRTSPDGWRVLVGHNAASNDYLTFRLASPWDFWFHAQGVPGSHVVVLNPERRTELPLRTVRFAARIAAGNSKSAREKYVTVVFTQRRHVRRIPGPEQGRVTYRNERTIRVRPAAGAGTGPDSRRR